MLAVQSKPPLTALILDDGVATGDCGSMIDSKEGRFNPPNSLSFSTNHFLTGSGCQNVVVPEPLEGPVGVKALSSSSVSIGHWANPSLPASDSWSELHLFIEFMLSRKEVALASGTLAGIFGADSRSRSVPVIEVILINSGSAKMDSVEGLSEVMGCRHACINVHKATALS